jgi:hypothetical protein
MFWIKGLGANHLTEWGAQARSMCSDLQLYRALLPERGRSSEPHGWSWPLASRSWSRCPPSEPGPSANVETDLYDRTSDSSIRRSRRCVPPDPLTGWHPLARIVRSGATGNRSFLDTFSAAGRRFESSRAHFRDSPRALHNVFRSHPRRARSSPIRSPGSARTYRGRPRPRQQSFPPCCSNLP